MLSTKLCSNNFSCVYGNACSIMKIVHKFSIKKMPKKANFLCIKLSLNSSDNIRIFNCFNWNPSFIQFIHLSTSIRIFNILIAIKRNSFNNYSSRHYFMILSEFKRLLLRIISIPIFNSTI